MKRIFFSKVFIVSAIAFTGCGVNLTPLDTSITAAIVSTCPAGFVRVEKNTEYTSSPFCVSKYDMKNISGVAVSQPALLPWASITRAAASTACTSLGSRYSLPTNNQWQTIARDLESVGDNWSGGIAGNNGGLSRGDTNGAPNAPLAADPSDNNGCLGLVSACDASTWSQERRTMKLSSGLVVWDMSGNVWKWMSDDAVVTGVAAWMSTITVAQVKDTYGPATDYSATAWTGAPSTYGDLGYAYIASTGGITRGGSYGMGRYAGIYATQIGAATTSDPSVGFRCVYQLDQ
jgi:formylglycine-generating enzyme required for sulfatase activity